MTVAMTCPCGQRFTVHGATFPKLIGCHMCGRNLLVTAPDQVSELPDAPEAVSSRMVPPSAVDREPPTPPEQPAPRSRRVWVAALLGGLVVGTAFWGFNTLSRSQPRSAPEPVIGGQPLSRWLEDLRSGQHGYEASCVLPLFAPRVPSLSPALCAALRGDGDPGFRTNVARTLGRMAPHDAAARASLREAIHDENPERAAAVVKGLPNDVAEVVPLLAEARRYPHWLVATAALEQLQYTWPIEAAVPVLLNDLKHKDHWVCQRAAQALSHVRLPTPEVVTALADAAGAERIYPPESLGKLPCSVGKVVPVLLACLDHAGAERRLGAVRGLGSIPGTGAWSALPALKRVLKQDADAHVRREAALALAHIGYHFPGAVLAELSAALGDNDDGVRRTAAVTLSGTKVGISFLLKGLKDSRIAHRRSIVKGFQGRGIGLTQLPVVLALLRDPDADLRRTAVSRLEDLCRDLPQRRRQRKDDEALREALPGLVAALRDEEVRWRVAALLSEHWSESEGHRLGLGHAGPYRDELWRVRRRFAADPASGPVVRDLAAGMRGRDAGRRRAAVVALVLLGQSSREAIPAWFASDKRYDLDHLIDDGSPDVLPALAAIAAKGPHAARARSILTLLGPDAAAAVPVLKEALETGAEDVPGLLYTLARIGPAAARTALAVKRLTTSPAVGKWAAEALLYLEPQDLTALPQLRKLVRAGGLWGTESSVLAARAMARIDSVSAVAAVLALARDKDPVFRSRGFDVLTKLGRELAVPALHRLLREAGPASAGAASLLWHLDPTPDCLAAVAPVLVANGSLVNHANPAALPALLEAARTVDDSGREVLVTTLALLLRDHPALTPEVLKGLDHASPAVRWLAIRALHPASIQWSDTIHWPGTVPALLARTRDGAEVVRLAATEALLDAGPEALPYLAELLNGSASSREKARRGLSKCGAAAVPLLRRELCRYDDPTARRNAASLLAENCPRELALAEWVALLRDPDGEVRDRAVDVLLGFDTWSGPDIKAVRRDLVREQAQALHHPAAWVRSKAVARLDALARRGAEVLPILIDAVGDRETRWMAIEALRREGLPPQAEAAVRAAYRADLEAARKPDEKGAIRERYDNVLGRPKKPLPEDPAALARLLTDEVARGPAGWKLGSHDRARLLLALAQRGRQPAEVVRAVLLLYDRAEGGERDACKQALRAIDPEVAAELGLR